jgi:DNA-binding transcriptional ArsR family regulator
MKLGTAAGIMAQLGNETRLKIVRLLVKAGEDGMTVGDLQSQLSIPASTLSHHISHLRHAGLLEQHREGTTLYCVMNYETMDAVVRFLTEQCCTNAKSSHAA